MENNRRLIFTMLVMVLVLVGYQYVFNKLLPPPKPVPTTAPAQPAAAPGPAATPAAGPATATAEAPTSAPAQGYAFTSAEELVPVPFGGETGDALRMELSPRGATLCYAQLYAKDPKGRFVYAAQVGGKDPYELLGAVDEDGRKLCSFATYRVGVKEWNDQSWRLDDVIWKVVERTSHTVVFTTSLAAPQDGQELLQFTKTYALRDSQPVFDLGLMIENRSPGPLTVWVEQEGPLGINQDDMQYDMRKLLVTQLRDGAVSLNRAHPRADLLKTASNNEPASLMVADKGPFAWTALVNKYFGVFTHPLPPPDGQADFLAAVSGLVAAPKTTHGGDLLSRLRTKPATLQPAERATYPFEVYVGPKDADNLRKIDPSYVDPTKLNYAIVQSADQRCMCTFLFLQNAMIWLLESIHRVVRNYGVAIIVLVIIVRGALHKLAVYQQKNMFRMQESMARIQPRMEALKERFANDKVRLNQETMKLWGEEGVNPAGHIIAFIPLFIQMPILVALWSGINSDINLRHAPFDGWWIRDLSAPDGFVTFASPVTVPVLSELPLIGSWFQNIASINLLPILMGISMWLQQKYMPKPAMQAKLDAARKQAAAGKKKSGMSAEDQLRQQQMMAYVMAIIFPLMFYRMPAGLNLYWMATNVFGIFESLIIRKQINEERKRRELHGPPPPKKGPGLVGRFFRHIVHQAEELQRKADEMSRPDSPRADVPDTRRRKRP